MNGQNIGNALFGLQVTIGNDNYYCQTLLLFRLIQGENDQKVYHAVAVLLVSHFLSSYLILSYLIPFIYLLYFFLSSIRIIPIYFLSF